MSAFRSRTIRFLSLWAVLAAATVLTGLIPLRSVPSGVVDGPLGALTAVFLVNGLAALVLSGLVVRLSGPEAQRRMIVFAVLFLTETGLSWIEAVFFNDFVRMSGPALAGMALAGLFKSAVGAFVAVLLWPQPTRTTDGVRHRVRLTLATALSFVGLSTLYVILYFAGGAGVAWSSATVRAFYGEGMDINPGLLALLQIGRGAIWTGLAALLAARLQGRTVAVAGLVGAAFAVLMAAPLLYPSAVIPWAVRQVHLVELCLVNFIFGALAVAALRRRIR